MVKKGRRGEQRKLLAPMMMTKVDETVENMTLEQLMETSVWPAAVSTAAVALIPKERASCVTCGQGHASLMSSDGAKTWMRKKFAGVFPGDRTQECVWIVLLAMEGEDRGVASAAIDSSPSSSTW